MTKLLPLILKSLFGIPMYKTVLVHKAVKSILPTQTSPKTRPIETIIDVTPKKVSPRKTPTPPVVKQKDLVYKVNQKACEQYLFDRMVESGMHNLTSKFNRKGK